MRGISVQEWAAKHGRSYTRARMLVSRLGSEAKKVPAGQPGAGSWVISPLAGWPAGERGRPKKPKNANSENNSGG